MRSGPMIILLAVCGVMAQAGPARAGVQFQIREAETGNTTAAVAPGDMIHLEITAVQIADGAGVMAELDSFTYRITLPNEAFILEQNEFAEPFHNVPAPAGFNGSIPWATAAMPIGHGADAGSPHATPSAADLYRTTASIDGTPGVGPDLVLERLTLTAPAAAGNYLIALNMIEAADRKGAFHEIDNGTPFVLEVGAAADPPAMIHELVDPLTTPCSGYIDPRMESSNGSDLDMGLDRLVVAFDQPVFAFGGGPVNPASFVLTETGGGAAPSVSAVLDLSGTGERFEIQLSRPLTLQAWTTLRAEVQGAAGTPISNSGDLGPGSLEPDRIDVAFLPGDIDQNGTVQALDLLRFRQHLSGTCGSNCPDCGGPLLYFDTDRNGAIAALDLLRYRQLLFGTGSSTQPWSGASLNAAQP